MAALAIAMVATPVRAQTDPLPSWNDGASRKAVTAFVERVTRQGSPDFVPPAERIATFDNDGTLWAEQPLYFQVLFAMERVRALAPKHPEWQTTEPFASLLKGDTKAALAGGEHAILEIVAASHAGISTDEFQTVVKEWLATAKHPTTGRLYTSMTYKPMLEVLSYLRANGFKTFIVSGGGARFCLFVHHTDAAREWAYDRASSVGRFDKGLDEARAKGWTVVDMKSDWKVIYP